MKTINSSGFSKLLNLADPIVELSINDTLEVSHRGFKLDLVIKNCVFNEFVTFKDCRFFKSLFFENCTFEKGLLFNTVEIIGSFDLLSNSFNNELTFKDCTFSQFSSKETHYKKVLFCGYLKNNAVKNEDLSFENSYFTTISFNDLECHKTIRLNDLKTDSLEIYRSNFYSEISLGYFEEKKYFFCDNVYMESSKFLQRIDFYNGKIEETLYIHKVEFEEQVVISKEIDIHSISFNEVRAKHNVSIDFQDNFEYLRFSDCWFNTSLTVHNFDKLTSYSKSVNIDFDGVIYGNYIIEEIPTLGIHMSCINFGNIIFHNIDTKFIIFSRFFNYNKLFFNSIRYNKDYNILVIFDSNIGNTEFENIDFRKFNEVIVVKSDVSSMLLTNSLFPKEIQIKSKAPRLGYEIPELERINDNMYFRDSYRQLKVAMEKMGNRYYSLIYKSKEMYYQRRELKWSPDKILLYINYLSNNNGISWMRGITFTLSCAFISFVLLNFQLHEPLFYWTIKTSKPECIEAFKIGFKSYISFISSFPVLKLDYLKENWVVDMIKLLSRIFISVGIYQTIAAFRKYGK